MGCTNPKCERRNPTQSRQEFGHSSSPPFNACIGEFGIATRMRILSEEIPTTGSSPVTCTITKGFI